MSIVPSEELFDVVFTTNRESDLKLLAVAGRSLLENCRQPERVRFHIVYSLLEPTHLRSLEDSWKDLTSSINFYSVESQLGELALRPEYGYWYRVWLGEVLPSSISKVLYLDCDVVVHGDVSQLWSMQLGDKVAGVVWDPGYRYFELAKALAERARKSGLSFPQAGPYFNTGVLLIDLIKWRQLRISDDVEQYFGGSHQDSVLFDQDELNILLQGKVLALNPTFNLIEPIVLFENWDFKIYRDLAEPASYFQGKIRHFSGASKACSPLTRSSEKANFYDYLDRTEWAGWRSDSDLTWWGKPLSELVELHYLVVRGIRQRVLSQPFARIRQQLQKAPYTTLLYIGIPFYRSFLKIKLYFSQGEVRGSR